MKIWIALKKLCTSDTKLSRIPVTKALTHSVSPPWDQGGIKIGKILPRGGGEQHFFFKAGGKILQGGGHQNF